jgi:ligand-binding sensor domain-containing protein/DNA-binding CsgD family transcriptional regulator
MKKIWLSIILSIYLLDSACQSNLGMPEIINYYKYDYSAGTQNWGITQDKNGIVYFANNEGLLSFDGTNWKIYPLPNKTIVRSVAIGPDGKIYVGGQDEMGYFSPDNRGELGYNSLLPFISKKELSFADVWNIIIYNNSVFFRSTRRIFEYNSNKIISYPGNEWRFLGKSNSLLLAQDSEKGILKYKNGFWEPFDLTGAIPDAILATSLISLNSNSSLLTTLKDGCFILKDDKIFKWNIPSINSIALKQIYSSTIIDKNLIVFATTQDGCYIVDLEGKPISHFSRSEGIQNNNILSVYSDAHNNIWLGLNNGIDFISYNSAVRHIYPDIAKDASGYTSIVYDNHLYMGTSNGLYKTSLKPIKDLSFGKSQFQEIANTEGQVWNLSEVNSKLLMGHHEGSFIIENNKATPIDKSSGFWTFLPYSNVLPSSLMIAGTYQGIGYYQFKTGKFTPLVNAPFESARFVSIEGSDIWVSHPYKGIFKIIKNKDQPEVIAYTKDRGINSVNGNYLFKLKNNIIVTSENGIFQFNHAREKFEPSPFYNKIFENITGIRYLKEDTQGNIWFVFQKKLGVVDLSGNHPTIIYITELNNKILSGFENVYAIDSNNIIVGAEKGYYHINYEKYKQNTPKITAGIRMVRAFNKTDSVLFGGYEIKDSSNDPLPHITYNWNTFHFEFSSTLFGHQPNIEYSYLLDGFDKIWSEWGKKTSKEYTNLPAGTYTFKVKARNNLGNESTPSIFSFQVLAPWYQTSWAIAGYILLLGIGFYTLYYYQRKKLYQQRLRHIEEQQKLQYLHQLELDQNEKQIVKLKNEKLESEIQFKNKELATVAMHLVQKGELLTSIKEELIKLKSQPENSKPPDNFKKIIKIINEEEKMDEDWEHFAVHFDKVHSDFLLALKNKFPTLSANELKLSAYLRMNLSSKEIAQLMNISVRGVEIGRYRLRKKLQIPTETNLFHFLMNFNTHNLSQIHSSAESKMHLL